MWKVRLQRTSILLSLKIYRDYHCIIQWNVRAFFSRNKSLLRASWEPPDEFHATCPTYPAQDQMKLFAAINEVQVFHEGWWVQVDDDDDDDTTLVGSPWDWYIYIYIHIFTHMNGCFWLVKCIGSRYTIHMDPPQTWALQKLTGILLLFAVVSCRNPIIRYFPRSCWRKLDENRHKKDDSAQKNDSMSV